MRRTLTILILCAIHQLAVGTVGQAKEPLGIDDGVDFLFGLGVSWRL
jgi:hypothetical protein